MGFFEGRWVRLVRVLTPAEKLFRNSNRAMSDGSDGSGSDIDPDEMPGEFSSTAENLAPDELPAEWFSDSAPESAPSTPAATAAAAPPAPSTVAAGSPPPTRPRSPSAARSYYAGLAPRPPPTPPLVESPSRLSNRAEGAPRAGGREEEEERAVRQDSLKAQMDWLVALEDADPDLEPISSGAPAEIEISVVVPDGASPGRRLQGQIEVGGKRRTVDVVLPQGVQCGDVLQVLIPVGAQAHANGGQVPTTDEERARFNIVMGLPESDRSPLLVVRQEGIGDTLAIYHVEGTPQAAWWVLREDIRSGRTARYP